jgi:hypothetical protein
MTSLINTRDWAIYACTSLYTSRVHTAKESGSIQQCSVSVPRALFNPHLPGGFLFCKSKNIKYLVLRYLKTGALPVKEFSEDWLFHDNA